MFCLARCVAVCTITGRPSLVGCKWHYRPVLLEETWSSFIVLSTGSEVSRGSYVDHAGCFLTMFSSHQKIYFFLCYLGCHPHLLPSIEQAMIKWYGWTLFAWVTQLWCVLRFSKSCDTSVCVVLRWTHVRLYLLKDCNKMHVFTLKHFCDWWITPVNMCIAIQTHVHTKHVD